LLLIHCYSEFLLTCAPLLSATFGRLLQSNMDDEDFPRGKRRKLNADAEVKEVRSASFDKELFSEVNYKFIMWCLSYKCCS